MPVLSPVNGHYYEYVALGAANEVTWDTASAMAATRFFNGAQGRLAVILSAAENTFITNSVMPASDPTTDSEVWIGGRSDTGTFTWIGGQPFVYTNWDPSDNLGVPDSQVPACTEIILGSGFWQDSQCGTGQAVDTNTAFVVEFLPVAVVNVPTLNTAALLAVMLLAAFAGAFALRKSAGRRSH